MAGPQTPRSRGLGIIGLVGVILGGTGAIGVARAATPTGGDATTACRSAVTGPSAPIAPLTAPLVEHGVDLGPAGCRVIQSYVSGAAAGCRTAIPGSGASDETCAAIDGRPVSDARIAAYRASWVHRALTLQRGIDDRAPLLEALLPHTHNSFNAPEGNLPLDPAHPGYTPSLTNQDPNQAYPIAAQLGMDVRAIEMDLHWVPSIYGNASTGGYWVTLCHGNSGNPVNLHIGCSIDRPAQDGFDELAGWLRGNPGEFVLLYLENQLSGNPQAHALAGQLIHDHLGGFVEQPTTPCAPMDFKRSKSDVRNGGHQVVIVGNCDAGAGNAWGAYVHERGPLWDEHGDPSTYTDTSPMCAEDRAARATDTSFRRHYEDSTTVAAVAGSNPVSGSLGGTSTLSATAAAAMARCGANLVGFDQLTPEDPRLAALVWSWAPEEPRAGAGSGDCAAQGADGRWRAAPCTESRHLACESADGTWRVTAAAETFDHGQEACEREFPGTTFATPVNGYRNQLIVEAKPARADEAWIALRLAS